MGADGLDASIVSIENKSGLRWKADAAFFTNVIGWERQKDLTC
jgi:hypothetical protein